MKKKIIVALCVLASIIIGIKTYKMWQFKSFGYSQPKLETLKSIDSIASMCKLPGNIALPKDSNCFDFIKNSFGYGRISVFNSEKQLIIDNVSNYNGECYQDIQTEICNNFQFKQKTKNPNANILYDSLIKSIDFIKETNVDLKRKYKYTIVYGWVKYIGLSLKEKEYKFAKCVSNNDDILILSINSDYVNSWYDSKIPIPILKY